MPLNKITIESANKLGSLPGYVSSGSYQHNLYSHLHSFFFINLKYCNKIGDHKSGVIVLQEVFMHFLKHEIVFP